MSDPHPHVLPTAGRRHGKNRVYACPACWRLFVCVLTGAGAGSWWEWREIPVQDESPDRAEPAP